jgi:hypothetical protein
MSFFSKLKVHSVLLVDIASSSVGVGLSGVKEGRLPELVVTTRVPFAHKPDFDFANMEQAMILALRDALNVAFKEGTQLLSKKGYPSAVNHCVISFSSPWFVSKLGGKQADFVSELKEKYAEEMELFGSDWRIYSATHKKLLKRIEDEIIRVFGIKEGMSIENFTVLFSKVMHHAFDDIEPAMFVDMTGHMTDVLAANKKELQGHHSIPVGTHSLESKNLEWNAFWRELAKNHDREFSSGNVFLIADNYDLGIDALQKLLPEARIIPFGKDNGFVQEMATLAEKATPNERLAIILTFSNLFL